MSGSSGVLGHAFGLVHWVSFPCGASVGNGWSADTNGSSIVGPMIGGALAKPVESLPSVFTPGSLWDRFPYLLPNLFSAICVMIGLVIGILFMEETHAEKKKRRDRGLELGNALLSWLQRRTDKAKGKTTIKDAEEQPLLFETDESLPVYLSTEESPSSPSASDACCRRTPDDLEARGNHGQKTESKPTGKIFTKPVVIIIASYGILAL